MQKQFRLIAVLLLLIGISFVWGCGGGEETITESVEETITGEGTITFNTSTGTATYTGQLVNGVMHGQGTAIYASGHRYEGGWKDGKRHGQGTFTSSNGRYEAGWKDDLFHGQYTFTSANGDTIRGEYKDGEKHGESTFTSATTPSSGSSGASSGGSSGSSGASSGGSSGASCGHDSCAELGPFPCMGKNDTCTNTTNCAYVSYCNSCR